MITERPLKTCCELCYILLKPFFFFCNIPTYFLNNHVNSRISGENYITHEAVQKVPPIREHCRKCTAPNERAVFLCLYNTEIFVYKCMHIFQ